MCLVTASKRIKAETDLLVYKCLDTFKGINGVMKYYTPYQYVTITFNNGVCKMTSKLENVVGIRSIKIGIHSYFDKESADTCAISYNKIDGTKVFYAIIPKDAEYYFGCDGDIVSNKLIIFQHEKDYTAYAKENIVKKASSLFGVKTNNMLKVFNYV